MELTNQPSLFDLDRTILQHNLFGVDLNEEAVEICRLSIWIKTAQRRRCWPTERKDPVGKSIFSDPVLDPRAVDGGRPSPLSRRRAGLMS